MDRMKWIGLNINLFKHYGNQLRTYYYHVWSNISQTPWYWTPHAQGFCSTLKNPKEIPHALDRFREWYVTLLFRGGVVQITTEPI